VKTVGDVQDVQISLPLVKPRLDKVMDSRFESKITHLEKAICTIQYLQLSKQNYIILPPRKEPDVIILGPMNSSPPKPSEHTFLNNPIHWLSNPNASFSITVLPYH
jgi:hypothetical protein